MIRMSHAVLPNPTTSHTQLTDRACTYLFLCFIHAGLCKIPYRYVCTLIYMCHFLQIAKW